MSCINSFVDYAHIKLSTSSYIQMINFIRVHTSIDLYTPYGVYKIYDTSCLRYFFAGALRLG